MHFPKSQPEKYYHEKGMCFSERPGEPTHFTKETNRYAMIILSNSRSAWVIGCIWVEGANATLPVRLRTFQLSATPTVLCNLSCLEHSYSYMLFHRAPCLHELIMYTKTAAGWILCPLWLCWMTACLIFCHIIFNLQCCSAARREQTFNVLR